MDVGSRRPCLFDSDVTAIRAFVRELVAQSVVPHMENRIAVWNEQFASRRRGISGRFMSLSKKWTGFGSASRNSPIISGPGGGVSGNYDSLQEMYRFDTPEAMLRKLADYAFMLRDYKLAASIFELVRTDYGNDRAWKYLAGANEMCVASGLLNPLASAAKTKPDNLDLMLETATSTYLARCKDPMNALRSIVLGIELLKVRGRAAAEIAAKWAIRTLELDLVGSIGQVLIAERIASCFASRIGADAGGWGHRKRKAAFWSVMAADEWLKLGKAEFSAERLDDADTFYGSLETAESTKSFDEMTSFLEQLALAVHVKLGQGHSRRISGLLETNFEQLDFRSNRRSLLGPNKPLEVAPLSPTRLAKMDQFHRHDDDEFGTASLSRVRTRNGPGP